MSGIRKGVILSAGHGTRLLPLTADRPKVMLPVRERPLLEHHVLRLRDAGVRDLYMNLHAHPHVIQNWFGDGSAFGVSIHYAFEPKLRGTAGSLNGFRDALDETFVVQYGDVYSELDLTVMGKFHRQSGGAATLAIHPSTHPEDSDIVEVDGGARVIGLHHKPGSARWGNMGNAGFYILEPSVLPLVPETTESDFIRDVFTRMLREQVPIYGFKTADFLFDMGTPDRYERLKAKLTANDDHAHAVSN